MQSEGRRRSCIGDLSLRWGTGRVVSIFDSGGSKTRLSPSFLVNQIDAPIVSEVQSRFSH